MKILLLGQNGQLAFELQRSLSCLGSVVALGRTSEPALDLTAPARIEPCLSQQRPDLIINAAAYTRVDQAETEPESAFALNHTAVEILAQAAATAKIPLIHYSTDYVFDGRSTTPYPETQASCPLGVYGASKWAGEEAVRKALGPHLILRTAWVYGQHGQNFLRTMLRLMAERDRLGIVDDQLGAPTWSRQIAEATALIALRWLTERDRLMARSGTYHLSSAGVASWYEFACQIQKLALERGHLQGPVAALHPLSTEDYPTPARRPAYSVLDSQKLEETFSVRIPHWTLGLSLCLEPRDSSSRPPSC